MIEDKKEYSLTFEPTTSNESRAMEELGLTNIYGCGTAPGLSDVVSRLLLEVVSLRREITSLKMEA